MQKIVVRKSALQLPTTAKLFGALGLGTTGYVVVAQVLTYLPPGTGTGGILGISIVLGMILGWRVIGLNPGRGYVAAGHKGFRAGFILILLDMAYLGGVQMMRDALRGHYNGAMDALTDVIAKGLGLAAAVAQLDVIVVLFLGAYLSSIVGEWAWKRWR